MNAKYDVIVIGAGFAGVTAARDLRQAGKRVLIVEARDRIGGRTWYVHKRIADFDVEVGGGWLGADEQYAMSEVERYEIPLLHDEGAPEHLLWRSASGIHKGTLPVPFDQLADAERALFVLDQVARRVSGVDFNNETEVAELADLEVPLPELFESLSLPVETLGVLEGFWSGIASADWSEYSVLAAARLIAASGGTFMGFMGTVMLGPRFATGTTSLVEAILNDSGADLVLNTCVAAIYQDKEGVRVETSDGQSLLGSAIISTIPINALRNVTFHPELSAIKREAISIDHPGRGFKLWMVVKGLKGGLFCMGAPGPFHHLFSVDERGDETLLVGFGDAKAPDTSKLLEIEQLLRQYLPEAELVACDLHDWREDEFSRSTWLVQSPGFITRYEAELRRPEGRIFFAGADYSQHRPGYIDGAIESARTVAGKVGEMLS